MFDTDDDRSFFLVEIHCHPNFRNSLKLDNLDLNSSKDLEKDLEKLSKNQIEIINQIRLNNQITQSELSSIISINEKNIRNNINKLKKLGKIRRVGPDFGGYWEVLQ